MVLSVAPKLIWIYLLLDLCSSFADKEYYFVSSFLFFYKCPFSFLELLAVT